VYFQISNLDVLPNLKFVSPSTPENYIYILPEENLFLASEEDIILP
jgi:hypothetical protein